ncbi:MAG TPA: hypothetical protein VGG39_12675 [Polyangiaceae bacterium]|jgi:hypothetical protein
MLVGAILVLALVIWWVAASGRSQRTQQLAERRSEVETWEHDDSNEIGRHLFRLHFPTMRLTHHRTSYSPDVPDGPQPEYLVRRTPSGVWEIKLTDSAWRDEIGDLERRVRDHPGDLHWEGKLDDMRGGPTWTAVSESLAPAIEVAYQSYIHRRA